MSAPSDVKEARIEEDTTAPTPSSWDTPTSSWDSPAAPALNSWDATPAPEASSWDMPAQESSSRDYAGEATPGAGNDCGTAVEQEGPSFQAEQEEVQLDLEEYLKSQASLRVDEDTKLQIRQVDRDENEKVLLMFICHCITS